MTCTSVQGRSQVAYVAMNKFQPYESPRFHWAPASTSMESLVLTRLIAAAGVDSVGLPGPTCQGGKNSLVISQPFSKQDAKIHLMIMNDHWWFDDSSFMFDGFLPFWSVLYSTPCIIRIGYSTDVQEISASMAQLGSSALGAPRNYPFETHGINMASHHFRG